MYGILGSVNYNVPFGVKPFKTDLSIEDKKRRRINNVVILSTEHNGVEEAELSSSTFRDRCAIAFFGTLENQRQLALKYHLKDTDDRSLLIKLFEIKGIKMVRDLKGVFAFALYDTNNRRLFLSRDRSNNRPLYLYNQNGNYVFSSELRALVDLTKTAVDYKSIARCLCLGDHYDKSTPYEFISEIENGHYVVIDTLTGTYDNVSWDTLRKPRSGKSVC